MHFYVSIFKNSKVVSISRYEDAGPGPKAVNCETQEEVDTFWAKLSECGATQQCGWLQDQYGVSWQIVPTILGKLMQDKDAEKSKRVTQAMMQMTKIEIAGLKRACEQR
jgi:predicted 3-demethylubiquinone-9 3-methyltransferase (glyoxalase superfamily)